MTPEPRKGLPEKFSPGSKFWRLDNGLCVARDSASGDWFWPGGSMITGLGLNAVAGPLGDAEGISEEEFRRLAQSEVNPEPVSPEPVKPLPETFPQGTEFWRFDSGLCFARVQNDWFWPDGEQVTGFALNAIAGLLSDAELISENKFEKPVSTEASSTFESRPSAPTASLGVLANPSGIGTDRERLRLAAKALRRLLEIAPDKNLRISLVLVEDRYERSFGDGQTIYLQRAFWSISAARHCVEWLERNRSPNGVWLGLAAREVVLKMDCCGNFGFEAVDNEELRIYGGSSNLERALIGNDSSWRESVSYIFGQIGREIQEPDFCDNPPSGWPFAVVSSHQDLL